MSFKLNILYLLYPVSKYSQPEQLAALLRGYMAAQLLPPVYDNEALTGHPDEMDFPGVDRSDCVVTAGLRVWTHYTQRPFVSGMVIENKATFC